MSCGFAHSNGHSYETALLLSVFLGMFGIDRFYLGYPAIGKVLTIKCQCTLLFVCFFFVHDCFCTSLKICCHYYNFKTKLQSWTKPVETNSNFEVCNTHNTYM